MVNFEGMRFPIDLILVCIDWYAAYPLSYRHLEEMMQEHGMSIDHSSINQWAIRFLPLIEKMARKQAPGRRQLTHGRDVHQGQGCLERPLQRSRQARQDGRFPADGEARHDRGEALFDKTMGANGALEKVAIDKSCANKAAIDAINTGRSLPILVRQVKYLVSVLPAPSVRSHLTLRK